MNSTISAQPETEMATNQHTYTTSAPHVTGAHHAYTGGESMPGAEAIYPTPGCHIRVARSAAADRATVSLHVWNDTMDTALGCTLDAGNLRRLAHRLLDAAADLEAQAPAIAWCWATGLIEIGTKVPADSPDGGGAIEIARGPQSALAAQISVNARHGYGGQLLVPGVPEAKTQKAAGDALAEWLRWCAQKDGQDEITWTVMDAAEVAA